MRLSVTQPRHHALRSTILPCVLVVLAISPASRGAAAPPEPRVIEVIARDFEFVPPVIEVVQGETVKIVVTSDGLHGLGIKKFKVSKEIPRGQTMTIEFTPDAAGAFPILCTEYCGDGHDGMQGVLVVKARGAGQP